jgi:hypothetical protein
MLMRSVGGRHQGRLPEDQQTGQDQDEPHDQIDGGFEADASIGQNAHTDRHSAHWAASVHVILRVWGENISPRNPVQVTSLATAWTRIG